MIANGLIVAEGTPQELKNRVTEGKVLEIEVYGGIADDAIRSVRELAGVQTVSVEEREQARVLVVKTGLDVTPTTAVLAELNGAGIGRIAAREPTLEDAYVALVSQS